MTVTQTNFNDKNQVRANGESLNYDGKAFYSQSLEKRGVSNVKLSHGGSEQIAGIKI